MPSSIRSDLRGGLDDALDPVALTARLASIDSVNPSLVEGAAGERDVARFVAEWCAAIGLEVHVEEVVPGRSNVIAVQRGTGGGRSIILNGHLDTVGSTHLDTMRVAVEADHPEGARLTGRGVLDTKGGLACALTTLARAASHRLAGDVIVAAVIDEEYGSLGTEALVERWHADGAIVLEPTSMAVCPQHRGFAVIDVIIDGIAAHTSRPDRGANAAHAAADVIRAVVDLDDRWASAGQPIGARPLTLVSHVGTTSETFTVPTKCRLTVEVRTTAAGPDQQVTAVRTAIEDALTLVGGVSGSTSVAIIRPPLGVASDHPLITTLCAAIGRDAIVEAAPFWTDAALHASNGTPAVVFGPVGEGLHEDLEWVSVDSLHRCAHALTAFVLEWCA